MVGATEVGCGALKRSYARTLVRFVPVGFELGRWDVTAVAVQPFGVVPVDPAEGGQLDVVDRLPWSLAGTADQLSLVEAVGRLGQSIDAPICQECRWGASGGEFEWGPGSVVGDESVVDLAGDEPFQAADDVFLGQTLGGAAGDVVDGGLMSAHAHDHDSVERCVGLAMSSPEEAVPVGDT